MFNTNEYNINIRSAIIFSSSGDFILQHRFHISVQHQTGRIISFSFYIPGCAQTWKLAFMVAWELSILLFLSHHHSSWPYILPLQSLLILDAVFIAHAEVLDLWLDCCCHDVFQTLANISRVSSLVSLPSLFRC